MALQPHSGVCGTCTICLSAIAHADETFIDPCYHHFCYKASHAAGGCLTLLGAGARDHQHASTGPQHTPSGTCPALSLLTCATPAWRAVHKAVEPEPGSAPAPAVPAVSTSLHAPHHGLP